MNTKLTIADVKYLQDKQYQLDSEIMKAKNINLYERKHMWFKSMNEKKEFLNRYDIQSRKKSDFKDVEIILVKGRIRRERIFGAC